MHIAMMIDLETLGLENSALILSAGIVIGDLDNKETRAGLLEREYFLTPSSQKGRTISVDTLEWWMKQISEGVALPNSASKLELPVFLQDLDTLFILNKVDSVWSKGADFDIKILENAYKQVNRSIPWTYRQVRCFRTVEALFDNQLPSYARDRLPDEAAHGALSDAKYQYRKLSHYWDFIAEGR